MYKKENLWDVQAEADELENKYLKMRDDKSNGCLVGKSFVEIIKYDGRMRLVYEEWQLKLAEVDVLMEEELSQYVDEKLAERGMTQEDL